MASAADFEINIMEKLTGQNALTHLEKLKYELENGAGAIQEYEKAYERAMGKVGESQERVAAQQLKVQGAEGTRKYQDELAKLVQLQQREAELVSAADAAKASLDGEKASITATAQEFQRLRNAEKEAADEARKLAAAYDYMAEVQAQAKSQAQASADMATKQAQGLSDSYKFMDELRAKARSQHDADEARKLAQAEKNLGDATSFASQQRSIQAARDQGAASALKGLGAVALVAAAVFVKLAKAIAEAVVEVVKFAMQAALAEQRQRLLLSALLKSDDAGKKLSATFREIQSGTGVATEDLTGWTRQLKDAKLKTSSLDDALKGLALQKAATGEANVGKLLEDLKAGKTTAKQFREEMEKVYGKNVAEGMKSLDKQWDEAKRKVAAIFGKVDLGPLQDAAAKLFKLLEKPEVVAALQKAFEGLVTIMTAIVERVTAFMESFDEGDAQMVLEGLKVSLIAIGVVLGVVAAAVGVMVAPFLVAKKVVDGIVAALQQAYDAAKKLFGLMPGGGSGAAFGVGGAANDNGMSDGRALADGLTQGMQAGQGGVAEAAAELGRAAKEAIQAELDIHSPSKVGAYMARMVGAGMEGEYEAQAPRVARSAARMARMPASAVAAAGGAMGGRGGASVQIGTMVFHGATDPKATAERVKQAITEVLEGEVREAAAA